MAVEARCSCETDVLVLMAHRNVIKAGLHLIGVGETTDEKKLDELPEGWNSSSDDVYVLKYEESGRKFLMKSLKMGRQLLVHFLRLGSDEIYHFGLNIDDFVQGTEYSNPYGCMTNMDKLEEILEKEFLGNIFPKQEQFQYATRQDRHQQVDIPNPDPLRMGRPPHNPPGLRMGRPPHNPPGLMEPSPFGFGDSDRMPPFPSLGGGMGGMVMDPFRRGGGGRLGPSFTGDPRLPRGAVPPGARFDPFGPPLGRGGGGERPEIDYDHLPPPGFDDMYM